MAQTTLAGLLNLLPILARDFGRVRIQPRAGRAAVRGGGWKPGWSNFFNLRIHKVGDCGYPAAAKI